MPDPHTPDPRPQARALQGLEYDWLATDADGHVAFMTTAGGGYAPDAFIRDVDAHRLAIAELWALTTTTKARLAPSVGAGCENEWLAAAERGLFAFDADLHGGPYTLVAAPKSPVRLDQLPPSVQTAAVRLSRLRFALLVRISEPDLREHDGT